MDNLTHSRLMSDMLLPHAALLVNELPALEPGKRVAYTAAVLRQIFQVGRLADAVETQRVLDAMQDRIEVLDSAVDRLQLALARAYQPLEHEELTCDCAALCASTLRVDNGVLEVEDAEGSTLVFWLPDGVRVAKVGGQ